MIAENRKSPAARYGMTADTLANQFYVAGMIEGDRAMQALCGPRRAA